MNAPRRFLAEALSPVVTVALLWGSMQLVAQQQRTLAALLSFLSAFVFYLGVPGILAFSRRRAVVRASSPLPAPPKARGGPYRIAAPAPVNEPIVLASKAMPMDLAERLLGLSAQLARLAAAISTQSEAVDALVKLGNRVRAPR